MYLNQQNMISFSHNNIPLRISEIKDLTQVKVIIGVLLVKCLSIDFFFILIVLLIDL